MSKRQGAERQPVKVTACAGCHAPHSPDELHAYRFTGKFLGAACHPALAGEDLAAADAKLTRDLGREVRLTAAEVAAFDRIFAF